MDYSKYKKSNIFYGGSEKKIGIKINNVNYMVKFQKNTPFGKRYNHVSEYIGCKIFNLLGYETQEVHLGKYNNEFVVVCLDFIKDGYEFVPFNDVGESSLDSDIEKYQYSYEDIIDMLKKNKKITNVHETIEIFWEMFIIDALLGNFDRHGANWGFLKKDNKYKLAPIFDNGSCLYPSLINDDEIKYIMTSEEETNKRIYTFPTSQVKINNQKSSYYDVISSNLYEECNKALKKVYNKINLKEIYDVLDNTQYITQSRRNFYKYIIKERYEKIIKYSYTKLMVNNNE